MKTTCRIAIIVSKFNTEITRNLLQQCQEELVKGGMRLRNLKTVWVPGAYELPYTAHKLASSKKYDAVICLGCIIKGETSHDLHVANWVSMGIGMASLQTGVPVLFGVLTPKNEKQALTRSRPGALNRGKEVARAALEMIDLIESEGF